MPTIITRGAASAKGFGFANVRNVFLLDALSQPAACAYSTRKLRKLYTGYSVRLRRSSDNAVADIGFTASGDFDKATALSFVGGGNGFVVTWYDQSGNGNHVTQATASYQPQMIVSGAFNNVNTVPNGPPTMYFNGSNTRLDSAGNGVNLPLGGTSRQASAVVWSSTASQNGALISYGTASSSSTFAFGTNTAVYVDSYNGDINPAPPSVPQQVWNIVGVQITGSTTGKTRVNGTVSAIASFTNTGVLTQNSPVTVGTYAASPAWALTGYTPEIILLNGGSDVDAVIMAHNQGQYYKISVV